MTPDLVLRGCTISPGHYQAGATLQRACMLVLVHLHVVRAVAVIMVKVQVK